MNTAQIYFSKVIIDDEIGSCITKSCIAAGMMLDVRLANAIFSNKNLFNRFKRKLQRAKLKTDTRLAFQYSVTDPHSLGRLKLTSRGETSEFWTLQKYVQSFIEEIRFEALRAMYSQRDFDWDKPIQPNFVPLEIGPDARDISEGQEIIFSINREKKNSTSL